MRRQTELILIIASIVCGLTGCSETPIPPDSSDRAAKSDIVTVYVVNYPLAYFAERIGGKHVDVAFPAPPEEDPAFWTPDAEVIVSYQHADLIILNGASYANWTRTVSLPESTCVDTSASFADRFIKIEDAVTHAHGPSGEHAHGNVAFTTWIDPKLAIEQARTIAAALTAQRPVYGQQFSEGFASLEKDLIDLDASLEEAVREAKDRPLVFSHPVYQYLERRHDLNGQSVHWEPDEAPTDAQWNALVELLRSHPAKVMIWEDEPEQATASRLRELGVESIVFSPCGAVPDSGDYLTVMRQNASNLARALGNATPVNDEN